MNNTNTAPGFPGLPATAVASATGLTRTALYRLHEWGQGMGAPGHFHYPDRGELTYTLKGLCALVEALSASGQTVGASALSAVLNRLREETGAPPPAAPSAPALAAESLKEMHRWDLDAERKQDAFYGRDGA